MGNKNVKWWDPDKIIKDLIWNDLISASKYAKGRMLDIGCGNKPYYEIFKNKVDIHIGIDKFSECADIKEDFFKAKIRNNNYDTILCTQVIEHVENPQELLIKMNRILKRKGILIMTIPFIGSLHEVPTDYFRFTKYSIDKLLTKAGFEIKYIKEEGNWISSISNLTCFYLESTLNRFFLKYPKKVLLLMVQYFSYIVAFLPSRITKPDLCPINYIVVAN